MAELNIEVLNQSVGLTLKQTRLSDEQLAQAEAAFLKLKDESLVAAVDFFLAHRGPQQKEISVRDAIEKFIATKTNHTKLRPRSLNDYRSRLGRLSEFYGNRLLHMITRADLETLIFKPGQAPDTANGNRRVLHSFFAWCISQEYQQTNPVSKIATAARDDKEPDILKVAEVRRLLQAAMAHKEGVMLPYTVLSLFMGLRPEEVARLEWKDIDLEQKLIRVQGAAAKLRQRRIVEMAGYTAEWLLSCFGRPIVPKNLRRDWDAVRRLAGFKGSWHKAGDESLKDWPHDVIRHTAISHHYANCNDDGKTAQWAGHSTATLHRHYKGLVTPQEASAFWALKQSDLETKITVLQAAA